MLGIQILSDYIDLLKAIKMSTMLARTCDNEHTTEVSPIFDTTKIKEPTHGTGFYIPYSNN